MISSAWSPPPVSVVVSVDSPGDVVVVVDFAVEVVVADESLPLELLHDAASSASEATAAGGRARREARPGPGRGVGGRCTADSSQDAGFSAGANEWVVTRRS